MELVVRLWDVYLAVNDPALVFFLLAALLVRNRQVREGARAWSTEKRQTQMRAT